MENIVNRRFSFRCTRLTHDLRNVNITRNIKDIKIVHYGVALTQLGDIFDFFCQFLFLSDACISSSGYT